MNAALVLRDAGKKYRGIVALHPTDLVVPAGRFIAVMGKSGSGKSTLLRCAAGLDRPDSGSVLVAGIS